MSFSFFAETAMAQAAQAGAAPKGPSITEMLVLPLGMIIIMYFFVLRPQQRKAKEHSDTLGGLKSGDEVYTSSGIIGRVRAIAEGFVTLEVAANTNIKVLKSHIGGLTKSLEKPQEKKVDAKA